jgi:hypothetical protein
MTNGAALAQSSSQKAVMLILGSANPHILQQRVNVAVRLYNSDITFNRIIVSGGCGAHGSSICEASRMDSLLQVNGIPARKIFKEEKSKTTKQNYCYSKSLKRDGKDLIRPDDRLYVVSSHWHAIPVASCFRAADGITHTVYHIEGSLNPRGPVDYTHIFKDCRQPNYCRAILWPRVDAAYYNNHTNKIYYFVDNIFYRKTPGDKIDPGYPKKIEDYPGWPQNWSDHVDAAYYKPKTDRVFLLHDTQVISLTKAGKLVKGFPKKISTFYRGWTKSWGAGYVDAAYYNGAQKKGYLFKNSEYLIYRKGSAVHPQKIKTEYAGNWLFQWGEGNIDAAFYDAKNDSISLYRGTDYLKLSSSAKTINSKYPEHTPLPWPTNIWGKRPETN